MSYTRVNWQNAPSTATPVNAENLNKMDKGIADAHSQLAEIENRLSGIVVDISMFPIIPPEADDTGRLQRALDYVTANNGTFVLSKKDELTIDSVSITDKSNFKLVFDGTLKRKDNGTGGAMFSINGCSNFEIPVYYADGNIANNGGTINEHQHLLAIGGDSINVKLGFICGKNSGGDVLYINKCNNIQSDAIFGYGEDTGRNTLTFINGRRAQFNMITSIGVGTEVMPGGVDLEPNLVTDVIEDVQFGKVYIEGRGQGAFGVGNHYGATCRRITVDSLIINKRTRLGTGIRFGLYLKGVKNVRISKAIITENQETVENLTLTAISIIDCDDVEMNIDVFNVAKGMNLGFGTNSNNIRIKGQIRKVLMEGIEVGGISNSVIDIDIEDCAANGDAYWYLKFGSGTNIVNTTFKGALRKVNTGFRAVTVAGNVDCEFIDCDFSGWAKGAEQVSGTYTGVTKMSFKNCKNYNYHGGTPNYGYWMPGDFVENNSPSILGDAGSKYTVRGWRRITKGTSNTLNADWVEDRALTGA